MPLEYSRYEDTEVVWKSHAIPPFWWVKSKGNKLDIFRYSLLFFSNVTKKRCQLFQRKKIVLENELKMTQLQKYNVFLGGALRNTWVFLQMYKSGQLKRWILLVLFLEQDERAFCYPIMLNEKKHSLISSLHSVFNMY